jgi:hypothetical protein
MDEIKDLMDDYIFMYWRRFSRRVDKLIQFIKLGWNDYDWDVAYLYTVIDSKLDSMGRHFSQHGISEDNDKTIQKLRVLKKSLAKFQFDDYGYKYQSKKLPFKVDFEFEEHDKTLNGEKLYGMYSVYEGTKIKLSKEDQELYHKVLRQSIRFEVRMKKKYKKIFFKTLYKHERSLWD